jgi:hypothetical protein
MFPQETLNTIVEQSNFTKKFYDEIENYSRLEIWKLGLDWLLARNPCCENSVDLGNNYRVLKTADIGGFPPILVFYLFKKDEQKVYLIEMEIIK